MRKVFVWLFKWNGWKMDVNLPANYDRCVVIAAPHTSNWDFVYSLAVFFHYNLPVRYLAKNELFRWPIKGIMEKSGGLPVYRHSKNKLVDEMIQLFKDNEKLMLAIPAEGTRSKVEKWKTGFYHVALGANVPILLGYLDYNKKLAGFGPLIYLTGDPLIDANQIKDFYKTVTGKFPEKFNLEGLVLTTN
ncbi:MAG: 1-acyl-sn-glycerol-3-phosphate acyltransferase [Bacteroidota bacterium]